MKKLSLLLAGLFALYSLYWAWGRNTMVEAIMSSVKDNTAEGYVIDHKGLSAGGFPLRFRSSLQDLSVTSPRTAKKPWSIRSDLFRIETQSYNPLILDLRHRGDMRVDMRSSKGARWLFDVRPFNLNVTSWHRFNGSLKAVSADLSQSQFQAVIGTLPPVVGINDAALNLEPSGDDMQVNLSIGSLFLSQDTAPKLQAAFGPAILNINVKTTAIGLQDLNSDTFQLWAKNGRITTEHWSLIWGDSLFSGDFDLTTSETGLTGTIGLRLDDLSELITQFQTAGILTAGQASAVRLTSSIFPKDANGFQTVNLIIKDGYLTFLNQPIYKF